MSFRIENPTERRTEARIVKIDGCELFFSYRTLIACRKVGGAVRVENSWGPTTGRHFNELGASNFKVVSTEELEAFARVALQESMVVAAQEF